MYNVKLVVDGRKTGLYVGTISGENFEAKYDSNNTLVSMFIYKPHGDDKILISYRYENGEVAVASIVGKTKALAIDRYIRRRLMIQEVK